MSDGGGESGRDNEQDARRKSGGRGGDDFGRAIAKIAVAQICENVGFQSFQQSALESLSDVAIRYLRDLGKTAHFYANLAGRTHCNVFDVIQGLEDLGSSQGFSGASDVNRCLASSGTVREISQYVSLEQEIPFARPVPRFPVTRNRKPTPSFLQIGETPPGNHIPPWLPAFPDPHTYIQTPVWNERATDPRTDKVEQARQRRKAERSLLNLQQRLACNGSVAPAQVDPADAGKLKRAAESNPFLASPLQQGEKDVSPVVCPAKLAKNMAVENQVSVLEAFAPAIEAVKSGVCESVDAGKKVLPNKRPTVHFKFGIGKKALGAPVDLSLHSKSAGKTASWFGKDEEKDDKKRRAEKILKESMENQQEFAQ
ncbi:PREDICTED: transcription initiation factor TFIID subunit 8-like [Nelumbo nucifera]|uniref:Transcription initiation factor TFIID subunit 8 n=1 Tax=Nelumbo nucifera TaxID=4432 RepID=A0A1U8AEE9_NELNU|nr:PREDICTED: transcription initiation factor TFIID subunit 8-like [Nelumbo nucifera]